MTKNHEIILKDVSFAYRKRKILENVNLVIESGDFASIVGPNGGGKTTLVKMILGLLKPDSGTVTVFGKSPEMVTDQIGYMPQYAYMDMEFPANVMDVVLMGRLRPKKIWFSKEDRKQAEKALEQTGLRHSMKVMFNELSGGQRQRVLIARAICSNPSLLLLDEPTSNVDQENEAHLLSILKELNQHMTILLVSHDLGFVSHYVKSVICVNQQVVRHPTSNINGTVISDVYKTGMKMVMHDHRCSEEGHHYD